MNVFNYEDGNEWLKRIGNSRTFFTTLTLPKKLELSYAPRGVAPHQYVAKQHAGKFFSDSCQIKLNIIEEKTADKSFE